MEPYVGPERERARRDAKRAAARKRQLEAERQQYLRETSLVGRVIDRLLGRR
jgi:hypothetical protein